MALANIQVRTNGFISKRKIWRHRFLRQLDPASLTDLYLKSIFRNAFPSFVMIESYLFIKFFFVMLVSLCSTFFFIWLTVESGSLFIIYKGSLKLYGSDMGGEGGVRESFIGHFCYLKKIQRRASVYKNHSLRRHFSFLIHLKIQWNSVITNSSGPAIFARYSRGSL